MGLLKHVFLDSVTPLARQGAPALRQVSQSSLFQSRAFQIPRDCRENTLAPTQCCHVVTDHKPKPLPPCCFTLGTCVLCFYFIGTLVESQKKKKKLWLPFHPVRENAQPLPSTFLVSLLRAGCFPSVRSSLRTEHFRQTHTRNPLMGGVCVPRIHKCSCVSQGGHWQEHILLERTQWCHGGHLPLALHEYLWSSCLLPASEDWRS